MTDTVKQTATPMENSTNELSNAAATSELTIKTWGTQMALASELVKSQLCPLKKPEDVVVVLNAGRELGLTPTVALNGIHVINGRFTLGVHIIVGLLLKHKITFTIVEDYEYIKVKNQDGSEGYAKLGTLNAYDRKTSIKFKRRIYHNEKEYEDMEVVFTVKLSEMLLLGLLERDQWQKQPRTMLRSRCFTMGGKLIAADIFGGLYEYTEMLDANKVDYQIKDDDQFATVTVLDVDPQSSTPN